MPFDTASSQRLVAQTSVLRSVDRVSAEDLPKLETATEALEKVRVVSEETPTKLSEGKRFTTLLNRLEKSLGEIRERVDTAWVRVRSEEASVDEVLLAQIAQVPDQEIPVANFREALRKVNESAGSVPDCEED